MRPWGAPPLDHGCVCRESIQSGEAETGSVFDAGYHTILDLHSYGHDIETAWLLDRGVKVLGDEAYEAKIVPITQALAAHIYETAFDGHSWQMSVTGA